MPKVALTSLTAMGGSWRHDLAHVSLMNGWLPVFVQVAAVVVLVLGLGWRTRRWRRVWLPVAALASTGLCVWAHWYVGSAGLAGEPAPGSLWLWIAVTGLAGVVAIAGWRSSRWWRRGLSALAIPASLLCAALALNLWVGYFPTVGTVWDQLTAGPLPNQTDRATVTAMQLAGTVPAKGVVVPVDIGSRDSHFAHRRELVYLPPSWFAANPPPRLPTVMMIGAEFNTPSDWLRAGDAITTVDAFALTHGGFAPVLVFVDSGGGFNIDTECVNGSHERAEVELGCRWLLVGWHLRDRPGGDASRAVRWVRRHRRRCGSEHGVEGTDGGKALRRQHGRMECVRSDDGHDQTPWLQRSLGLIRHLRCHG
jgi:hypothetical protein